MTYRIRRFGDFALLEKFDIGQEARRQKMPSWFLDSAQNFVDSKVPKGPIAKDMDPAGIDKFTFWVAKQIRSIALEGVQNQMDAMFKAGFRPHNITETDEEEKNIARWDALSTVAAWIKGKSEPEVEKILTGNHKTADPLKQTWVIAILENHVLSTLPKVTSKISANIIDYVFSPVRNPNTHKPNFVSGTIAQLESEATRWHQELKASGVVTNEQGVVIMKFPDGFYWIDLMTNSCAEEGQAMGHCGRTGAMTLLSLRKQTDKGPSAHVTVAIDYEASVESDEELERLVEEMDEQIYAGIHQCKGKGNKKPSPRYHRYIVDLLLKFEISKVDPDEYQVREDFHISDLEDETLINRVVDEMPQLYVETAGSVSMEAMDIVKPKLKSIDGKMFGEKTMWDAFIKRRGRIGEIWQMWKDGEMDDASVKEKLKDLVIADDKWLIPVKGESLKDLSFLYSDSDKGRNHSSSQEFVESYDDWDTDYHNNYPDGYEDVIDALDEERRLEVIGKIEKELGVNPGKLTAAVMMDSDASEHVEFEDGENVYESLLDADVLKDVVRAFDDVKDQLNSVYRYAAESATQSEMWKDTTKGLSNYFESGSIFSPPNYVDGKFMIRFHDSMAHQVESAGTYGLSGSEAEYSYSYKTPMESMLNSLFDWDAIGFAEDNADWAPIEISFPHMGWDESPGKNELIESFDNHFE